MVWNFIRRLGINNNREEANWSMGGPITFERVNKVK